MNSKFVKTGKGYILREKDAAGVRGILCRSLEGKYFFRVYHDYDTFDDYDLTHNDLAVTIDSEEMASFYETKTGEKFLDHSSQVYGWEKIEE